jgi:hypothetical protein
LLWLVVWEAATEVSIRLIRWGLLEKTWSKRAYIPIPSGNIKYEHALGCPTDFKSKIPISKAGPAAAAISTTLSSRPSAKWERVCIMISQRIKKRFFTTPVGLMENIKRVIKCAKIYDIMKSE